LPPSQKSEVVSKSEDTVTTSTSSVSDQDKKKKKKNKKKAKGIDAFLEDDEEAKAFAAETK